DGLITYDDLKNIASIPFTQLVHFSGGGTLDANLPLSASIAGVSITDPDSTKVQISSSDLFDPTKLVITLPDRNALLGFSRLTPGAPGTTLIRPAASLQAPVKGLNRPSGLPLVGQALGAVVRRADVLPDLARLLSFNPVVGAPPPAAVTGFLER